MLCSNQLSYIAIVLYFLSIPLIGLNEILVVGKSREFCRFTSKMSIPALIDYYISNYSIEVSNATTECFLPNLFVVAMNPRVLSSVGYDRVEAITYYSQISGKVTVGKAGAHRRQNSGTWV